MNYSGRLSLTAFAAGPPQGKRAPRGQRPCSGGAWGKLLDHLRQFALGVPAAMTIEAVALDLAGLSLAAEFQVALLADGLGRFTRAGLSHSRASNLSGFSA